MPERVTKEERLVSLAIEKARKVKQELNIKNVEPTQVRIVETDPEPVKITRPKAVNVKPKNQTQKKEGYGLGGENTENTIKKASREVDIINKYIMFLNNTSGDEFIEAIFGEPYSKMEDYRQRYVQKFMKERNSMRLWGMLDNDNRQRLVDAAMKKYK